MIRFLSAWFVLIWVSGAVIAKEPVLVGQVPTWVVAESFNPDFQFKKDNVSGGWLNILVDKQLNVAEEAYFYHYTRKIFSKVGVQNGSEISVNYDPSYEKINFHFVTIYRNGKAINKLDPKKIKVMHRETSRERFIYDGTLTAILTLEDVREGDIIDYAFSFTGTNPIFEGKFAYSFSVQQHDPLDKHVVRLITPTSRQFILKDFGKVPAPQISSTGTSKVYTWKMNQMRGLTMDDNVPAYFDPYPWVSISEYRNWAEVNAWALKLFAYPKVTSPLLTAKIDSIKKGLFDPGDRISAALDFVQNDIRYLGIESGISSHKPFSPAQVLNQRYGDCKDKANLLCFMLTEMGIKAFPVLVNTQDGKEINTWQPGSGAFNHCVVQVQHAGKATWLDPTLTHQKGPFEDVYFPNYRYGLVIKPGTTALSKIPENRNSKIIIDEQFAINENDAPVNYRVETSYFGYDADFQRSHFESNSLPDVEKNYLNYYAEMYPGIRQDKELLTAEDVSNNAFQVYENYLIDAFWTPSEEKENEVTATIYPQVIGSKISFPATKIRTMPFALEFPLHLEQTTTVFLPEAWNVEKQNLILEENGIFFSKKVTMEGSTLTIKYVYKTLAPEIEAKKIAAYVATQKKIQNELGYTFTQFRPALAATGTPTSWSHDKNPLFIFFFIAGLAIIGFGSYKMYHYDPAPADLRLAAHQLPVGGWLVVVAIGLAVTPLRTLKQVLDNSYLSLSTWERLGDPESSFYNPAIQVILAGEFMLNLILGGFAIMLLVLLMKRRSNLPHLIIGFYALNSGANLLETLYLGSTGLVQDNSIFLETGKAVLGAAIWIPYFLVSKRVKQTFGQRLNPTPMVEEPAGTDITPEDEMATEPEVQEKIAEPAIQV